jgi:hypothetical protein
MPFKRCLNFNNSISDFLDRVGADFFKNQFEEIKQDILSHLFVHVKFSKTKFSEPVELKTLL